jgi:hypothetical protein
LVDKEELLDAGEDGIVSWKEIKMQLYGARCDYL